MPALEELPYAAESSPDSIEGSSNKKRSRGMHGHQVIVSLSPNITLDPDISVDAESKEGSRCAGSEMEHGG